MSITYRVDPDYPQDTLAACEMQLRLLASLFAAAGTSDLEMTEKALAGLMAQLNAMADAIGQVETLLHGPLMAKAA